MATSAQTQLMFHGVAEQAMKLYVSLFAGSRVLHVDRYAPGEAGREGTVRRATFVVGGHNLACIDSPIEHAFTFTPSMSIFVECDDEAEFRNAFEQLSADGEILMPLSNYGFSKAFGWVNDRFGVSWQLSLR